jgi:hypothetical protein
VAELLARQRSVHAGGDHGARVPRRDHAPSHASGARAGVKNGGERAA